ncbi:hypothetical protein ACJMK2_029291 [Sinanodonta woodiana]|uniref:Uncharacterized protein n=1 Tax=Sinanodonta woodiana TaxID=1069815 RepID=A0ABD3XB76_SINWO
MLLEKHAPLRTKSIILTNDCPWYTDELYEAKHKKRKLELNWRKSKLCIDHQLYREQCSTVNKLLKEAKVTYYSNKIASDGRDHKSLYKITKHFLGASNEEVLPSSTSSKQLAQDFSNFFINKVEGIRNDIKTQNSLSNMNMNVLTPFSPLATNMMDFVPVS